MNKVLTYVSLGTLFIAGYCLFAIKGEVQELSYRFNETKRQISGERNSLNILKAEYAVLQSPKRLRALADKHLQLTSIKSVQIIHDPLNSNEGEEVAVQQVKQIVATPDFRKNVKWRYKTYAHRNHMKTVSHKTKGKR